AARRAAAARARRADERHGSDPDARAARALDRRGKAARRAGLEPRRGGPRSARDARRGAARRRARRDRHAGRTPRADEARHARGRRRRAARRGARGMRTLYWVWRRELAVTLRAPIIYVIGGLFLVVQGLAFAGLVTALSDPIHPAPLGALLEGQLAGTLLTW